MKKVIAIIAVVVIALIGLTSYNTNDTKKDNNGNDGSLLAQIKTTAKGVPVVTTPGSPQPGPGAPIDKKLD